MRLVIAIAARFRNFGLPMGDLIQEGHVGLLEAAARFEPERDVRFSTYATWWIRASIQDYILRNWSIVRGGTSSSQKALFFNLRRLRARLAQSPDQRPRRLVFAEIANALGVSTERRRADGLAPVRARHVAQRADPRIGERQPSNRQDFLVDSAPLPDETVGEAIDRERRHDLAAVGADRAQRTRTPHRARAPPARRGRDAGGARRKPRHLQGAGPPDREPRAREAARRRCCASTRTGRVRLA